MVEHESRIPSNLTIHNTNSKDSLAGNQLEQNGVIYEHKCNKKMIKNRPNKGDKGKVYPYGSFLYIKIRLSYILP